MIRARQFTICKPDLLTAGQTEALLQNHSMEGTEVFLDDIVSRDQPLFADQAEKARLVRQLQDMHVKRLHCSYWAYPTSFLCKIHFGELVERFGGIHEVAAYYGGLTGDHLFRRWVQEYELACALGAQAYTFHLIDYAPIDGAWPFTISKAEIRQAMVFLIQQLLAHLTQAGLLGQSSPRIELENAGWGLEHGTQTAEDYRLVFRQLHDPLGKVKIAWEINHILHAIGRGARPGSAEFMLPSEEITPEMAALEADWGHDGAALAQAWVESNVMAGDLVDKVGSLHLSDCVLKEVNYFVNGRLAAPYAAELDALDSWEDKESFGVDIVLTHYDSHVPLGQGILRPQRFRAMVDTLLERNPDVVLLHELKNSVPQPAALEQQLAFLWGEGGVGL